MRPYRTKRDIKEFFNEDGTRKNRTSKYDLKQFERIKKQESERYKRLKEQEANE